MNEMNLDKISVKQEELAGVAGASLFIKSHLIPA